MSPPSSGSGGGRSSSGSGSGSGSSSSSNPSHIQVLTLQSDPTTINIGFRTSLRTFAFVVNVKDVENLGWKEVRAVADCMELASVGKIMTSEFFLIVIQTLRRSYPGIQGPIHSTSPDGSVAHLSPARGHFDVKSDTQIVDTSFRFLDEKNDFLTLSLTKREVFIVIISPQSRRNSLNQFECQLFIGSLLFLEPGDSMTVEKFMDFMKHVEKKGYAVTTQSTDFSGKPCTTGFLKVPERRTSVDGSTTQVLKMFQEMLLADEQQQQQSSPSSSPQSSQQQQQQRRRQRTTPSPYPNITYLRKLKESGQAQVHEGLTDDGTRVAVKVFKEEDEATRIETYKTELTMILGMSRHPNIVTVHNFFHHPEPALVMDFIDGQDLSDYLETHGAFNLGNGLRMCSGIAEALVHMHEHGVIHRDLKSANILRRRDDGRPVIIDLGLSARIKKREEGNDNNNNSTSRRRMMTRREMTHQLFQTRETKGTMLWMAPEMITGAHWNDRTDVYAFGIIMWEIFSGMLPFVDGGTYNASNSNHTSSSSSSSLLSGLDFDGMQNTAQVLMLKIVAGERPDLSNMRQAKPWLKKLVESCWLPKPDQRPSMQKVLETLRRNDLRLLFEMSVNDKRKGEMSFPEFVVFLEKYAKGKVDGENMFPLFKACDVDDNGTISFEEFVSLWLQISPDAME